MNPFNLEPRIKLVDKNDQMIQMVNQVEAFHLLRNGFCTLQMVKPPTIRFELDRQVWDVRFIKRRPPKWFCERSHYLEARHSILYGNFHIQGPDGHEMFHCNAQKALWYLNRDIVDVVSDNPPTLRFKFQPGGPGHVGDPYYLTEKVNQCVVCGATKNLNRHHVMPRVFRRYLPEEIKDHNYHDVLLMCLDCHGRYEQDAAVHKQEICREMGIEINDGGGMIYLPEIGNAVKSARALLRDEWQIARPRPKSAQEKTDEMKVAVANYMAQGKRMEAIKVARDFFGFGLVKAKEYIETGVWPENYTVPEESWDDPEARKEECLKTLRTYLGKEEITKKDLEEVSNHFAWMRPEGYKDYGQCVIDKIGDIQDFTERWRRHFIEVMNPQFLPKHWDVSKKLVHERVRNKVI